MKSLSKYIEAKKQYYTQLFEIAQLTIPEKTLRDTLLAEYNEVSKWIVDGVHTSEQANKIFTSFVRAKQIPREYYDLPVQNSIQNDEQLTTTIDSEQGINEENEEFDYDSEDFINYTDSLLNSLADKMGIEIGSLPNFIFSQVCLFGCIRPFLRVYQFIASNKKEFIEELSKEGLSPTIFDEIKNILYSGEDIDLIRDCLADISVDLGGNRTDMNSVVELYETGATLINAMDSDVPFTDLILSNGLIEKFKAFNRDVLDNNEKILLDIVAFKMGFDPLCDKLSDKERNTFDIILTQPFIAPKLEDITSRTIMPSPNEPVEECEFTLPDNYFCGLPTSPNKEEYLSSVLFTHKTDVTQFVELINYIADKGYISNNISTKQLLAYRLTGRMRPKGILSKIIWSGGAARGADCLFLMKCTDSKDKFVKMRTFFDADFPEKDISSIVHSAKLNFMKKLSELFPEIYVLPNKYK